MWPDKRFVAVVVILLLFIAGTMLLTGNMMQPATQSEENCQRFGQFNSKQGWCDCNMSGGDPIECHLNRTLAEYLNGTVQNFSFPKNTSLYSPMVPLPGPCGYCDYNDTGSLVIHCYNCSFNKSAGGTL